MDEALLSIGQVAEASGLRTSALRYYEDVGLIQPAARIGGRRHYHPTVLARLTMIGLCQEIGFTVREIGDFLSAGSQLEEHWRRLAQRKLEELDGHIKKARNARRLLQKALECGCGDPARCEMAAATVRGETGRGRPTRSA